jgi:formylglycine-generating enzyme required for sulfatase activity
VWSGKHEANTVYRAVVTLVPKTGKTAYGVGAGVYSVVNVPTGTTVTNAANSSVVTVTYGATAQTIETGAMGWLEAPVVGAQPVRSGDTSTYTANVVWDPAIPLGGTFQSNTGYVATVTVTPNAGYTLTGVGANSMTATGAMVTHGAGVGQSTMEVRVMYGLVYVPAGSLTSVPIGSSNTLTAINTNAGNAMGNYFIGSTEVTWSLWNAVRAWGNVNGYNFTNTGSAHGTSGSNGNFPVHTVSWYNAVVWSNAYSEMVGLTPVYRSGTDSSVVMRDASQETALNSVQRLSGANGYQLPTNTQWELAARWLGTVAPPVGNGLNLDRMRTTEVIGGETTYYYWTPGSYASGAVENTSNTTETNRVAWNPANAGGASRAVGTTERGNALGMRDVTGNVWEWTFEIQSGTNRAIRGGSWSHGSTDLPVSCVHTHAPTLSNNLVGFRLSRAGN